MNGIKKTQLKESSKIILVNNVVTLVIASIFHFLFPIILNYPPNSINNDFQLKVAGIYYTYQYIIIVALILVISNLFLKFNLSKLDRWEEYLLSDNRVELEQIRVKCHIFPYYIYIIFVICPVLVTAILLLFISTSPVLIYKLCGIIFTFSTLLALISHIFSNRIFTNILYKISYQHKICGKKIGIRNKIYLQIFPAFIAAILFTSLVSYSRLVTEKGNLIFENYYNQLNDNFNKESDFNESKIDSILKKIAKSGDLPFTISPDGAIKPDSIASDNFFITYMKDISLKSDGRVYDYYGVDSQAAVIKLPTDKGNWIVGIKFNITSVNTIILLGLSFLILILLYAFALSYFSRTLAENISRVATNLSDVVHDEDVNLDQKLPVTSNDEIGDLVVAFNKILALEKDNINSIKEKQAILLEQERLASLGQLIGGIAHNLKTPIMSISGGLEALKDLAYEYRDSIGDQSVTDQDHRDIAKEMLTWLDKLGPYCTYMSDVISAVKGQAVQMISASSTVKFTVDEVVKRVDLLLKHELKKYHCMLKIDSKIDMSTEIKGEVNNLVQVFDNIIINAMQAYEGKNGVIELGIVRSGDCIEFSFKDYGKGIPKNVADRLFKEMVTTKGKNGTGLGLYMSYSTIKGRFGGNMSFTTKEGCGTTFFISLPCITYNKQEAV